jgi:hypothetical protein
MSGVSEVSGGPNAPDGVMYYSPHSTEITDEDLLFLATCETPVQ